jgi:hypothetical protein
MTDSIKKKKGEALNRGKCLARPAIVTRAGIGGIGAAAELIHSSILPSR